MFPTRRFIGAFLIQSIITDFASESNFSQSSFQFPPRLSERNSVQLEIFICNVFDPSFPETSPNEKCRADEWSRANQSSSSSSYLESERAIDSSPSNAANLPISLGVRKYYAGESHALFPRRMSSAPRHIHAVSAVRSIDEWEKTRLDTRRTLLPFLPGHFFAWPLWLATSSGAVMLLFSATSHYRRKKIASLPAPRTFSPNKTGKRKSMGNKQFRLSSGRPTSHASRICTIVSNRFRKVRWMVPISGTGCISGSCIFGYELKFLRWYLSCRFRIWWNFKVKFRKIKNFETILFTDFEL